MSHIVMVSCYLIRRKRRHLAPDRILVVGDEDEYVYEAWLVFSYPRQPDAGPQEIPADAVLTAQASAGLAKRLREAVAEVAADRAAGMAWHIDGLSGAQAAELVISLPDAVKTLARAPMGTAVGWVGIPAPAAPLGADVITTALLKPVLGPLQTAVHAFEIVGTVVGLLTGLHPLVVTCVTHLAHDELSSALAKAFDHVLSQDEDQALEQLSTRSGTEPALIGSGTVGRALGSEPEIASPEILAHLQEAADIASPDIPVAPGRLATETSQRAHRTAETADQAAHLREAARLSRIARL